MVSRFAQYFPNAIPPRLPRGGVFTTLELLVSAIYVAGDILLCRYYEISK